MARMKCMKYDRLDAELDSKEIPLRVFIGYIDGRNLGNVKYKDENQFSPSPSVTLQAGREKYLYLMTQ